jgi:hypothetical protein
MHETRTRLRNKEARSASCRTGRAICNNGCRSQVGGLVCRHRALTRCAALGSYSMVGTPPLEASRAITRARTGISADRGVAVLEAKLDGLRHQHQQARVKPALFIETRRPVARCLIKFEVANSHGPARSVSTTKRTLKPADQTPEGRSEGADLQNRLYTVGMVPPSMTYSVPVIDAARGEARNATRSATSFGCAGRPSGMPPREAIRPLRAAS